MLVEVASTMWPGSEATSTNMFKAALQRLPHGAFKSWKQLPAPISKVI